MKALDFFAGVGGFSRGLTDAGCEVAGHYERDAEACDSLRMQYDPAHVHQLDLAEPIELPHADLWAASPPCQPYSAAGSHGGADDPRDGYPHLWSLLEAHGAPTWLVVENVRNLLSPKHRARHRAIQAKMRRFFPWVSWLVLDAADYGVPQRRKRLITIAGPRPLMAPPPETHGPGRRHPHVTVAEALRLAPDCLVLGGGHNPNHAGDVRRYNDLTHRPSTTITAQMYGGAGNAGPFVVHEADDRAAWQGRRSWPDKPARTIGTKRNAYLELPDGNWRRFTWQECAILQSLQPGHIMGTSKTSCYRQAGNAIPPPLARAVVANIIQHA